MEATDALIEYTRMRGQIRKRHIQQNHAQSGALILTLIAFLGAALAGAENTWARLLLSGTAACGAGLGIFFLRLEREIRERAAFIHETLRPVVAEATGDPNVLGWEAFKAKDAEGRWIPHVLDHARLGPFWISTALPMVCYPMAGSAPRTALETAALLLALATLPAFFWRALSRKGETRGAARAAGSHPHPGASPGEIA